MSFNQSDWVLSVRRKCECSLFLTRRMMSGTHLQFILAIQTTYTYIYTSKFVIRREVQPKGEGKKPYTKAPKIQRLVTPLTLQRKRHRQALKRRRGEASREAEAEYKQLLAKRVKETKEK